MITDVATPKLFPSVADTHAKRVRWWHELTPQWRMAFQASVLGHLNLPMPEELENLWRAPALRFTGPTAPYPTLRFELTDCSGVAAMSNLEVLIITHHRLESVQELAGLKNLKSLFVNNNQLGSLTGVEELKRLEQVYAQVNQIDSLEPLRNLTNLRELYVSANALLTLNGITAKHARSLKAFFCLPNEQLPDREVIRFERKMAIRCRTL